MTCPYLEYRTADTDRSFDRARAYCTAVEAFVQPMRADVCNDRYDLRHDADCEFYRATESVDVDEESLADGSADENPTDGDEAGRAGR